MKGFFKKLFWKADAIEADSVETTIVGMNAVLMSVRERKVWDWVSLNHGIVGVYNTDLASKPFECPVDLTGMFRLERISANNIVVACPVRNLDETHPNIYLAWEYMMRDYIHERYGSSRFDISGLVRTEFNKKVLYDHHKMLAVRKLIERIFDPDDYGPINFKYGFKMWSMSHRREVISHREKGFANQSYIPRVNIRIEIEDDIAYNFGYIAATKQNLFDTRWTAPYGYGIMAVEWRPNYLVDELFFEIGQGIIDSALSNSELTNNEAKHKFLKELRKQF